MPVNRSLGKFIVVLVACSTFSGMLHKCLTIPAAAAEVKSALTAAELTEILREPDVGAKATNVQVVGAGPDITVMAQKESASGERDLKIDAIFLAKALFQKAGGQIRKVKVLFSQSGHDGRYITINGTQISEYGNGKLSAEQFLAALRLVPVEAEKAPDVVPGPQYERRLLVWQRIEKLRQQGTGVEPFEAIFAEVDASIKSGNQDPSKKLTFLETKLGDQEEALKQAKRTARGLGVPASKANVTGGAALASDRSPKGEAGSQAPEQTNLALPQDAVHIKAAYEQNGAELISAARGVNLSAAANLSRLKDEIDRAFRERREGEAFALIRKFHNLSRETTGQDMLAPPGGFGRGGGGPNNGGGQNGGVGPNSGGGPNGGFGGGPNGPF